MFVSPAFAQAAGGAAPAGPGGLEMLLPWVLIFAVIFFLIIRPQQKQQKQLKEMLAAIRRGDRVVTGGGIIGTVKKVIDDNEVQVEIAENVRVRVRRSMISSVLAKTEPVKEEKETKETKAKKVAANEDAGSDSDSGDDGAKGEQGGSGLKNLFGGKSK